MVRRELPATPAPAAVRNFRRLRVWEPLSVDRRSLIVSLLCGHRADREITTRSERLDCLCFAGANCQVASARLTFDAPARPRADRDPPRAGSLRRRSRLAARYAQTPAGDPPRPASLPGTLRHLSRRGWPRLLARDSVPDPARRPRGLRA